ncbi:hypothetical protein [Halorientalis pallida]|uniref:TRASH domain-containing protein n=1 Tax=Halorientalis pallida TaxID=2479928 RepID=A0A498KUW2_9EURY|nr:hypothetical protein [Halorientalis pallida]RXK48034.1 hypothetical protein EAF64_15510 [Halorientalis pallida]
MFAVKGKPRAVIDQLRSSDDMLWFPHEDQRAFVYYDPVDDEKQEETSPPWVRLQTRVDGSDRLTTPKVVSLIEAAASEFTHEIVTPVRCSTCLDPVPDTELVESNSLPETFCSATCLHECEDALEEPLTPTNTRTPYTSPLLRVQWDEDDVDFADAHLPRWSE